METDQCEDLDLQIEQTLNSIESSIKKSKEFLESQDLEIHRLKMNFRNKKCKERKEIMQKIMKNNNLEESKDGKICNNSENTRLLDQLRHITIKSHTVSKDEKDFNNQEKLKSIGEQLHKIIIDSLYKYEFKPTNQIKIGSIKKLSKENVMILESKWIEELCTISQNSTPLNKQSRLKMLKHFVSLPERILHSYCSKSQYTCESESILEVLSAYLHAYNIFIWYYGLFNGNIYEGFIEFISLSFDRIQVKEIIESLRLVESSLSILFLNKISKQLLVPDCIETKYSKLYKLNSCFRFIANIIPSRTGDTHDLLQISVQRDVASLIKIIQPSSIINIS